MAFHNVLNVLFFVVLSCSCYAQLSTDELRQVEYRVGNEKNDMVITKEGSSTEDETPQSIPKGNDIEEPFKKETAYCLGCVINVPTDQPGVAEMVERAVSAMDRIVSASTIHASPKILGVQKQVVNGIQYYIQIEVSLSDCPQSTSAPRVQCNPLPYSPSLICEVTFLDQPWNSEKPQLMGNNCTDASFDNDVENYTPDDLLAVERSSGVESAYLLSQDSDQMESTTEEKQESTTLAAEDTLGSEKENQSKQQASVGTGMTKAMDSSEIDLINELADIAVRTLNELLVGGSRKEVVDIVDAKKQIVNGLMYHLVLRVGLKSCADETADCSDEGLAIQSICKVQLHRSWAGDTPYKAKVVNSECEEAWEEEREGRQLSANWVLQDMYDPEYTDCIKAVLSKAYNIVPKDKATLTSLLRQDADPKNTQIMAELKLDSDKWTIPKPDKKEILILRPKVVCNSEPEKSSVKVEKEVMVGARVPADSNDAFITDIANFALEELDKVSNSPNKRMIVRIIEATTQVVAGKSVNIKMEIIPTDCPKGVPSAHQCNAEKAQDSEICSVVVLDQSWVPERKLVQADCAPSTQIPPPPNAVGALIDSGIDSPGVKAAVDFSVGELNRRSNSIYKLNVVSVLEAKEQVVSGILYHLKLALLSTSCKKDEPADANCGPLEGASRQVCSVKVWSQPWKGEMSVNDVECSAPSAYPQKSFSAMPDLTTESDNPRVKEAVDFAVNELNEANKSPFKERLLKVIEVNEEFGYGIYYDMKLRLVQTDCRKDDFSCKDDSEASTQETRVCSLKVLSRVPLPQPTSWRVEMWLKDVRCVEEDGPTRPKRSTETERPTVFGGVNDADKNSAGVQEATTYALNELSKRESVNSKVVLVEVVEAKQQVVAGISYHLTLKVAESNCNKDDSSATNCQALPTGKREVCTLKVWSKPWLNELSLNDVDCKVQPTKRSANNVLGGVSDTDKNSADVQEATTYALNELSKRESVNSKVVLVEVVEAKQQVVAGISYHLTLKVAESNCNKDDSSATNCQALPTGKREVCTLKVWSKPWLNERSLHDVDCKAQPSKRSAQNIPGGVSAADKNSPEIRAAVEFAVKEIEKVSNSPCKKKVIEVINAKKQVVAGMLYDLELKVIDTNCKENGQSSSQVSNADGQVCTLKVWSKPWLNEMTASDIDCGPPRSKRSLREEVPNGVKVVDKNSAEVAEAIEFAVKELDKGTNSIYKQKVVEIVEAEQQNVAGTLYHLTLKLIDSNCKKSDQTPSEECEALPNVDVRSCFVKVRYKPWIHETTLTESNCQPVRSKRSLEEIGGLKDVEDLLDPYIQDIAEYSRDEIDKTTNTIYTQKVIRVIEAKKQVVSGTLVHLKLELVRTGCTKKTKDRSNCQPLPDQESQICEVKVWDRPWLNRRKIKDLKCADAHIISSHEHSADAAENLFSIFINQFNKTYKNELERQRRLEIFKENLNVIKELQDTEQGTASYGPTIFADLTHEEFKKHYLGLRPDLRQENALPFPKAEIVNVDLPKEFDWRDHKAVTPVKNQGLCGSCWAFAVTGNIEGQYAIKYKKLLSFSEQELVDCDKLDEGCQGGLPDNAYRSLEHLGGLELEQDYPYDGHGESCSFNKTLTRVHVHGAFNISSNETEMAKLLIQNGPIAIGINANAMQFYMGGVSHPLKFLCSPSSLDHGVLIVGFGEHRTRFRKKMLPYWLIKNSWGKFWGEQGYYRVYRGDGSCGVNMMASSAIIE